VTFPGPLASAGTTTGTSGQTLALSATAAAGYDDNVLASDVSGAAIDPLLQIGGAYAATDLGLSYAAQTRAVGIGASGFSNFRLYNTAQDFTAHAYGGSIGLSVSATPRFHLGGLFGASHTNQYSFWTFPALTQQPLGQIFTTRAPEYGLAAADVTIVMTGASLGYDLTKRSSLNFQYGQGKSTYGGLGFDQTRRSYSGRYSLGFTKYASLRLGYGQERADYLSTGQVVKYGTADVGVDYGRPLSFSRRTKLTFGVNTLALDNGGETYLTVGGHANLNHEFRVWNADVAYTRGVGFIDGFADPFLADSISAELTGHLGRRVRVTLSTGYSNGDIGVGASTFRNFDSYVGSARTQVSVARSLALFGEYVFYHYHFDNQIALPQGTPHGLDRQGARAGLSLTVPILHERTPRVTR
jgi:hypothetical protein